MVICEIPISEIGVQLKNLIVTTPAVVRLSESGVVIEIAAEDCEYHFQFSLVNKKIQLIRRKFFEGSVEVSVEEIHDFSENTPEGGDA
jgi:hypothetical protein